MNDECGTMNSERAQREDCCVIESLRHTSSLFCDFGVY